MNPHPKTDLVSQASEHLPTPLGAHPPDRPATVACHVEVITDMTAFLALESQWDAFMQAAGIRNLCMTHAWLAGWLQHFRPDQLLVVIVRDSHGHWLGAAPMMIRRVQRGGAQRLLRQLQFIGTTPTVFDWMTLAIEPDANAPAVIRTMADTLRQTQWDVLDLQFVPQQERLLALAHALQPGHPATALREDMPIPYLELPETLADYEKNRRKKTRLEVNRHCNRFTKEFGHAPTLHFHTSAEGTDAILTRFFSGHIQYWAERGQKSDFERFPALYGFYKDMLTHADALIDPRAPKLLFSVLEVADYQLSYHLGFWQGESYLCHLTSFNQGFRSYSPGTIHMDMLVQEGIARETCVFEFGRGDEPYKTMWTKDKRRLYSLRLFRNPLAEALWQADEILKRLRRKPAG